MHLEGGVIVGGLFGVFEATTLVDGDVHEDGTLLHLLYGLLTHQLRCSGAWDEYRANDEVSFLQFLIDGGRIRNQGAHAAGVLVIEALQNVRIKVQHGDLGTQTVGHGNGGRANLATADHDDACWLGTWNTRNQQTAAALRGQQQRAAHRAFAGQLLRFIARCALQRLRAVIDFVLRSLEKDLAALKGKLASAQGDELLAQAVDVGGLKVLAAKLEGADAKTLRETMDKLKDKLKLFC